MNFSIPLILFSIFVVASLSAPPAIAAEPSATPMPELTTYYFALLTRGPKWTPGQTEETKKLQEAHMANMIKWYEEGKLVLAGPFADNGNWRGLWVFKTASLEEAQALAQTDPSIQAGRLSVEIHPWMTKKGVLP
jgi:uncharacterized protein